MATFPNLNTNIAYNALYNAYRLISTIGDNLSGLDSSLADRYKISAGEFEDQLVYTFCDILKSRVWDPTDANVLASEAAPALSQQAIKVDKKRQIATTIPAKMLTKQAWMNAGNFDAFSSVVESQIGNTRKIYDQRLMNVYVGTTESAVGSQTQTVTLSGTNDGLTIAEMIANIEVELKDSSRDYNDKGYMTSFDKGSFDIIFNSKYANKIKNVDLPVIFHKDGLFDFKDVLPARYFGTVKTTGGTVAAGNKIHTLVEKDYTSGHKFPGDLLATGDAYLANEAYEENDKIICKIIHKDAIKYASVIETNTEFFNAKNHSSNKYLSWMYGDPDRLLVRPFVTLKKA